MLLEKVRNEIGVVGEGAELNRCCWRRCGMKIGVVGDGAE